MVPEGFYTGDKIPFTLIVQDLNGNTLDITNWTITFRFKCGNNPAQEESASIIDAANGKARYITAADDFSASEDCYRQWTVQDTQGNPVTGPWPWIKFKVSARLT